MKLPVLVGARAVGALVGAVGSVGELLEKLRASPTWVRMAQDLPDVQEMLMPVPVTAGKSLRECVLVSVRSVRQGERLGEAGQLRVCVHDRLVPAGGVSGRSAALAQNIDGLVRGARRHGGSENVHLEQAEFPACESSTEGTACVLGLVVSRLCSYVKMRGADPGAEGFSARARAGLRLGFGMLRGGADQSGERDVLRQLRFTDSCREVLGLLSGAIGRSPDVAGDAAALVPESGAVSSVMEADTQPLRVLTWNIAGMSTSASGRSGGRRRTRWRQCGRRLRVGILM